ncbi:MAG: LysR family transcriptional regulator, partial [Desemzia incerta]
MNLQDLVYFNHLAKTLSFTATAQHFYVSQPSISMALKRLEKELDTVLIDRKRIHKNLHLTETGEILLKHSTQILTTIDTISEEIHDLKNEVVYFGFLPTIGGRFMTQFMPRLGKFSSSMKLIEEESSDVMYDLVQKGQVPLA